MKKSILVGSLILSSSFALASGVYADTQTNQSLPSKFSLLTSAELTSLTTMTDTEREVFLTAKGITRPEGSGTGNLGGHRGHDILTLTDSEKTALASMTEAEREAYFASKGLTRPTDSGSGNMMRQRPASGSGNTTRESHMNRENIRETAKTVTTSTTTDRASRIAGNKAKQLEQRKMKLQKKIQAGESLTRLEKKFAESNSIEY